MSKLCYVLPSKYPSGGNKICIEHLERLADKGFDCYISCVSKHDKEIEDWLPIDKVKEVEFKKSELETMDVVVATYWETAEFIDRMDLHGPEHFYFVQSTEWEFFEDPHSQMRVWATLLNHKFKLLTEARWIQRILQEKFRKQAYFVPNRLELPKDFKPVEYTKHKPVVLVEGNIEAPFKGVRDAVRAVRDLKDIAEIWLLTNTTDKFYPELMGVFDKKFQGVSWGEALEIISNADVFLKPSKLEGQSGPIMEAMALGIPVIACDIPSAYETIVDQWNGLLVPEQSPRRMKNEVRRILLDESLKEKLIKNGLETAKTFNDWGDTIEQLRDIYQ